MDVTPRKITSKYGNLCIMMLNRSYHWHKPKQKPTSGSNPASFIISRGFYLKTKNLGDGGWRELHFETHSLKNIALQNLQFDWYEISFHFLFLFQFLAQVAPFLVTPLCCCPPESSFSFRNWWEKGSICWPFIIMELYFQPPLFPKNAVGRGDRKVKLESCLNKHLVWLLEYK